MRRWISVLLIVSPLAANCGDPTDRPEDCSPNEYFDQARKLCFSCPAVVQPRCDDGCGFAIVADDLGCPAAECLVGDDCDTCGAYEYIDESLQCAPCVGAMSCAGGEEPTREVADGVCTLRCL